MKKSEFNVSGLIIILLFFCAAVLGACSDDDTTTTTPDAKVEESWLFVQTAPSGTLTSNAAAQTSGGVAASEEAEYTLTLIDVDSDMIAFSDRPDRDVKNLTVSEFVSRWDSYGFNDVPPNAALELMEPQGDIDVVIVELLNPVYDDDAGHLSYTVVPLSDEESFLESHDGRVDSIGEMPTEFDDVTLFIDADEDASGNGGTLCPYAVGYDMSDVIFIYVSELTVQGDLWAQYSKEQATTAFCTPSDGDLFFDNVLNTYSFVPLIAKGENKGAKEVFEDKFNCDTLMPVCTIDEDGNVLNVNDKFDNMFSLSDDDLLITNVRNFDGTVPTTGLVWTGSDAYGEKGDYWCEDTSKGGNAFKINWDDGYGIVGDPSQTDGKWMNNQKKECNEAAHIYCIQCVDKG